MAVTILAGVVPLDVEDPCGAFFHNVVLVINVNYEDVALNTTQFWRRLYSRFFEHIVVICRTSLPHIGVEGEWAFPRLPTIILTRLRHYATLLFYFTVLHRKCFSMEGEWAIP